MKTIQEVVNEKVAEIVESGTIEKMISDGVEKAVKSAVSSQFEQYGSVTKKLGEVVKKGLALDIEDIPMEVYNEQMLVAIKDRIGKAFAGSAHKKVMEDLDELLAPAPQEISIVDFVDEICRLYATHAHNYEDLSDNAIVEFEQCTIAGGKDLKIWTEGKETSYRSDKREDINLYISNGKIRINHNHYYNPTTISPAEAYIFKLYAAGTNLTGVEDFDPCDHEFQLHYRDDIEGQLSG